MECFPGVTMGQAETTATPPTTESASVEIDIFLAEYAQAAIELLKVVPLDDPDAVSNPCWRNLMVLRRSAVTTLTNTLTSFINSASDTLSLPAADYLLFDEVIACVATIEEETLYEKSTTLDTIATVIGVLGGGAALLALF